MIRFDLICENDHEFDSWFANNSAYEDQKRDGYVSCPFCHSEKISKQLMAPGIPAKSNQKTTLPAAKKLLSNANDPALKELRDNIRKMRKYVAENAENVGKNFALTARQIHYEEQPERPIYGTATPKEAESLLNEGVGVMPLPSLPEEKN